MEKESQRYEKVSYEYHKIIRHHERNKRSQDLVKPKLGKLMNTKETIYYVIWEQRVGYDRSWTQQRAAFSFKSSAIQYAKDLKESYTIDVREVEIAMSLDVAEELTTEIAPLCPVCDDSYGMVFHENINKWVCHQAHPTESYKLPQPRLPVEIGADGRCMCSCADPCALHRSGMEYRCTREELIAAGIPVTGEPARL